MADKIVLSPGQLVSVLDRLKGLDGDEALRELLEAVKAEGHEEIRNLAEWPSHKAASVHTAI